MTEAARTALVEQVDADIAAVAGTGFHVTPFERADALSDALGFGVDGGVWVKDETGAGRRQPQGASPVHDPAAPRDGRDRGSRAVDRRRPIGRHWPSRRAATQRSPRRRWRPLCNGRFGCSFHRHADPVVRRRAGRAGCRDRRVSAPIRRSCRRSVHAPLPRGRRRRSHTVHRAGHRERVVPRRRPHDRLGDGAASRGARRRPAARPLFVQVGAGTFAASTIAGFRMSGVTPRLHAVQTDSCAPLHRAYEKATAARRSACRGDALERMHVAVGARRHVGRRRHPRRRDLRLDPGRDGDGRRRRFADRGHRGARASKPTSSAGRPPGSTRRTRAPPASPVCSRSATAIDADERVAVIFSGVSRLGCVTGIGRRTDASRRARRGSRGSSSRSATGSSAASSRTFPARASRSTESASDGVESHRDEDWWLKAKLRRERLSYLPTDAGGSQGGGGGAARRSPRHRARASCGASSPTSTNASAT